MSQIVLSTLIPTYNTPAESLSEAEREHERNLLKQLNCAINLERVKRKFEKYGNQLSEKQICGMYTEVIGNLLMGHKSFKLLSSDELREFGWPIARTVTILALNSRVSLDQILHAYKVNATPAVVNAIEVLLANVRNYIPQEIANRNLDVARYLLRVAEYNLTSFIFLSIK
jgi:hypothetical protein